MIVIFSFAASQFIELQPAEYENNKLILDSLNFGASYIMRHAVQKDVLPDGEYEITLVNKVEQQTLENGTDYRFTLEIAGPRAAHVDGWVTVFIAAGTEDKEVTFFSYSYYFDRIFDGEGEVGEATEYEGADGEAEFSWEWFNFESREEPLGNEVWNVEPLLTTVVINTGG